MTVTLTGAGGCFTRLGHIGGGVLDVLAVRGGTATARVTGLALQPARIATLFTDYAAGTANLALLDAAHTQLGAFQSATGSYLTYLQKLAQDTVIKMVDDDSPLPQKTLSLALTELIRQMVAASASVEDSAPAAGAQTALGTPSGNAVVVTSVKNVSGKNMEYVLPETVRFTCTQDSQGGATVRRETVQAKGAQAQTDPFSHLWPDGSGCAVNFTAVDSSQDASSTGNLLTNSDFETFTVTNVPDKWTLDIGTAGTTVFNGTTDFYVGAACLKITGTAGAELTTVSQTFNISTGTVAVLKPLTQYAVQFRTKVSAVPAAGALRVALVDGSNAVINDAASVANSVTVDLTAQTTAWASNTVTFRTPALLPDTVKLQIKHTTAIESGKSSFVDVLAMTPMTQLYAGGPFAAVFSQSSKLVLSDTWTVAITNTFSAMQLLMERLFGMRALGLQFPSDASATIADSLIL